MWKVKFMSDYIQPYVMSAGEKLALYERINCVAGGRANLYERPRDPKPKKEGRSRIESSSLEDKAKQN